MKTIAGAAAACGLVLAAPVASGAIIGVNMVARSVMDKDIEGTGRKLAFLGMNTALCIAAGCISAFYALTAIPVMAAGLLSWIFWDDTKKKDNEHAPEHAWDADGVVIDAEFVRRS